MEAPENVTLRRRHSKLRALRFHEDCQLGATLDFLPVLLS
jgi:hypothetical protein